VYLPPFDLEKSLHEPEYTGAGVGGTMAGVGNGVGGGVTGASSWQPLVVLFQ